MIHKGRPQLTRRKHWFVEFVPVSGSRFFRQSRSVSG
jgi:hypothetical protein